MLSLPSSSLLGMQRMWQNQHGSVSAQVVTLKITRQAFSSVPASSMAHSCNGAVFVLSMFLDSEICMGGGELKTDLNLTTGQLHFHLHRTLPLLLKVEGLGLQDKLEFPKRGAVGGGVAVQAPDFAPRSRGRRFFFSSGPLRESFREQCPYLSTALSCCLCPQQGSGN